MANLPHITFFSSSATILLVVRSANGDGSVLATKTSSKVNLLNYDTFRWNCVILLTNRARYALNKEILAKKAFLEHSVVELVYKFDNVSVEKVSRPLKCHSNSFASYTYIYINIYGYQPQSHNTLLANVHAG